MVGSCGSNGGIRIKRVDEPRAEEGQIPLELRSIFFVTDGQNDGADDAGTFGVQ